MNFMLYFLQICLWGCLLYTSVADPFQAYQATRYVDTEIPHIPVYADGLEEGYATIATTNWLPYSWSINNVAFAEVMHTALAYFQAGRPEEAYRDVYKRQWQECKF